MHSPADHAEGVTRRQRARDNRTHSVDPRSTRIGPVAYIRARFDGCRCVAAFAAMVSRRSPLIGDAVFDIDLTMQDDEQTPNRSDGSLELAMHFASQFRTGVERTNTLLGAWGATLLLVLVASLLPIIGKLDRLDKAKGRASSARMALRELDRRRMLEMNRLAYEQQYVQRPDSANLRTIDSLIQRQTPDTAVMRRSLDSLVHDIANLSTPIGTIPIPYYYSALLWMVLLVGLLLLVLHKRILLCSILARIVSIHKSIGRIGVGRGAWAPFWLAPLPRLAAAGDADEPVPTDADLRRYLGWRNHERWRSVLFYACLGVGAVAFAGVAGLAIQVSRVEYPVSSQWRPPSGDRPLAQLRRMEELYQIAASRYDPQEVADMVIVIAGLALVSLAACAVYLRPRLRIDAYPEPSLSVSRGRRRFLSASGAVLALGTLYALIPRRYLPHHLGVSKRRFLKQRESSTPLGPPYAGRFWIHKRSRAIHYINRFGWALGGVAINPKNLAPYTLGEVATTICVQPSDDRGDLQRKDRVRERKGKGVTGMILLRPDTAEGKAVTEGSARAKDGRVAPAGTPPTPVLGNADIGNADGGRVVDHISAERLGALTEHAALMLVREGDALMAVRILWCAIERDTRVKKASRRRPSYRLYELVAGLAVRFSLAGELLRLNEYVAAHWPDDLLAARAAVWLAPSSRWRSRWTSSNFPWRLPYQQAEPVDRG